MALPGRPAGLVRHHIEPGKAQRGRDSEYECGKPAKALDLMQAPNIENERGRDPEIHEIGKRIKLGSKARGAAQRARKPSVQAIENGCDDDGDHCPLELAFLRKADGGEAHAEGKQSDKIGKNDPQRNRANASPRAAGIKTGTAAAMKKRHPGAGAGSVF